MARSKSYIWVYAMAGVGYLWLALNLFEFNGSGVVVCMFKQLTGLPCPSCGVTRSIIQIVAGDFEGALLTNPIGFLAVAFLIVFPLLVFYQLFFKRPIVKDCVLRLEHYLKNPLVSGLLIVLVLVNWCWNISKGL